MRILDANGVHRLLEAAKGTVYYTIFHLAVHTGLRRSELLGLRWKNIDLDMLTLSVVQVLLRLKGGQTLLQEPKTTKSLRQIALTPSSAQVLREHRCEQDNITRLLGDRLAEDSLIFTLPGGMPMTPDVVSHTFRKVARKAEVLTLRLHDLRHTHASLMLQQGIHPKIVSERLGHANIQMSLDTYSHVLPGLQEAAAQRFDLALSQNNTHPQSEMVREVVG